MNDYDLIIIGTGMGGGALAYALRDWGRKILLLERGDYLPSEPDNWNPESVFGQSRYKPKEEWYDENGRKFSPGVHYFVGGNTKVYGAALQRMRKEDFSAVEHEEGISPPWPISYQDLEPYYCKAEAMLSVHGKAGDDPTEPPRSAPFPFPAIPHEVYVDALRKRFEAQGLHPYFIPMGVDLKPGGKCIRCKTCDGFPCKVLAKSEADVSCVRPALASGNVELMTRTLARRLISNDDKVIAVEIEHDGQTARLRAETFVISCGAVNSAALLLRSASLVHPDGLGNSSGLVGRNYMVHTNTALMAINPFRVNRTVFQKTMAINDYYFEGEHGHPFPLGNLQLLGKLQAGMLTANQRWVPKPILTELTRRSIDWWVMSEDLPDPENRVTLASDGRIHVRYRPNNLRAHMRLLKAAKRILKRAGFPIIFVQRMGIETNSHQCGTTRFGTDHQTSVLNEYCQTHDLSNLFVVDSSFFPSSSAVNPALTIAAQALRVADYIRGLRMKTQEPNFGDRTLNGN
jgi:choline dehydrogenase-like flavoprotein